MTIIDQSNMYQPDLPTNYGLPPDEEIEGLGIEEESPPDSYPIDSILIRHEQRTVADVVRRIRDNRYIMDPDFQRDFIWDITRQSRLIESALMRIPLPVLYLAEQDDGRIVVVDGLQRLTTFRRYLDNEFSLKLEHIEYGKKRYSELSPKYQNRIEDTNLILFLIDTKVPEQVKLDIFDRVNSGERLTRQQMRNCIYTGSATRWLKEQASGEEFLIATDGKLNSKTMLDREMINRFCAFYLFGPEKYDGMDDFLANALKAMNKMSPRELEELAAVFKQSMILSAEIFGDQAFRKPTEAGESRNPINASLFDVFSTSFALHLPDAIRAAAVRIRDGFRALLGNRPFFEAISLGTSQRNKVRDRFQMVEEMLAEAIEDD
ncbi:MAG TPA: DUF262 domain-containing protein [Armatimonadota bacterium]|nr:DUF262 domain-containing protein [Armatimonadota bacterium]